VQGLKKGALRKRGRRTLLTVGGSGWETRDGRGAVLEKNKGGDFSLSTEKKTTPLNGEKKGSWRVGGRVCRCGVSLPIKKRRRTLLRKRGRRPKDEAASGEKSERGGEGEGARAPAGQSDQAARTGEATAPAGKGLTPRNAIWRGWKGEEEGPSTRRLSENVLVS